MTPAIGFYRAPVAFSFAHSTLLAGYRRIVGYLETTRRRAVVVSDSSGSSLYQNRWFGSPQKKKRLTELFHGLRPHPQPFGTRPPWYFATAIGVLHARHWQCAWSSV